MPTLPVHFSQASAVWKAAARAVAWYVLFAMAWILLSDRLLIRIAPDIDTYEAYSIAKGTAFVLLSAIMLYFLLSRELTAKQGFESDRSDLLGREQAARARAEAASRAKDELLAMVSHELRTPLTAILTSAEVLYQDPSVSEENRELAEMIRDNVLQESRIVSDLLDCSSLSAGKFELRLDVIDVHQTLSDAIAEIRRPAADKSLDLQANLDGSPTHVRGDRARLMQALRNLLANSIKFTPEGGKIEISTSVAQEKVSIVISDTGIGMSEEVRQRLFRPFEQGDRSITRQFGGIGVGLYLAKSIVELHGGTLIASSRGTGHGSTFQIDLPTVASTAAERKALHQEASSCHGMTVLLVEDNIDTLRVLGRLVGRIGCTVMAARSAAEALEIAGHQHVDLVVSDIGLPDQTGWDLFVQLRGGGEDHQIEGIAISGFDTEEDRSRSKQAGFSMHLVKPLSFPALQSAVLEIGARRHKEAAVEMHASAARN